MNVDKLHEKYKLAFKSLNIGDFKKALEITNEIKSMGNDYQISYVVSGLLIDIGSVLNKDLIIEGIEILEESKNEMIENNISVSSIYYNLANGYSALSNYKMMENRFYTIFKDSEVDIAIKYYRKALKLGKPTPEILVNLGNSFNYSGRVIDALDCYQKALNLDPDHGMALGNKAIGLYFYASLTGEHEATFLIDAYSLISKALKSYITPESTDTFLKYKKIIESRFEDENYLKKSPELPGIKIEAEDKFEKYMMSFCIDNQLYLNVCNFCQKCQVSIGDTVHIKQMTTIMKEIDLKDPFEKNSFFRLSAYLNQIKQDYVTARFLLILSRYDNLNLNFVDKYVKMVDVLNYNQYNVYIQLLKFSFKNLHDILDKIAFFINDYLKLGFDDWEISFRKVWYKNWKKKTIHLDIINTKNLNLNALFKIHKDLEDNHKILKNIRNSITHRFLQVRLFSDDVDVDNFIMEEDELVEYTLKLTKIVRNAIIYLLQFVDEEERKKRNELDKNNIVTGKLFAQDIPDYLKSDRHFTSRQ